MSPLQGIQIHRSIIYGSHARLLTPDEQKLAPTGHTHRWTVFLTGATAPPPTESTATGTTPDEPIQTDIDYLPGGLDSLGYLIKRVTFRLHETYPSPNRPVDKPPFKIVETGWGEFPLHIRVQFHNETGEKSCGFVHHLRLHHWGSAATAAAATAAAVSGPSGMNGVSTSERPTPAAAETPPPTTAAATTTTTLNPVKPDPEPTDTTATTTTTTTEPVAAAAHPDEPTTSMTPMEDTDSPMPTSTDSPLPASTMLTAPAATAEDDESTQASSATAIRNALPVHSWQYDQLVFTDPTPTLYALLLAHPETPLPERSLRASQRQIIERSAADLGSEPHGDGELDLSTTLDQGSTGVPIEFTRQLERGKGRISSVYEDTWSSKQTNGELD